MTTEIVTVRALDAVADGNIRRAAGIIRRGGTVVFPTETVYGLGADATSAEAAEKIYKAKGRPSDNPLIIHIAAPEDAAKYAFTDETYEKLARVFMPGPLTVILPSRPVIPPQTRGGLPTVAVRCPSDPIANRLIKYSGVPIAAPSANLSGAPSPTHAAHVVDDMNGRVDMIIDGGDSAFGLESTIVKVEDDGSLILLRPGKITLEDLRCVVGRVSVSDAVTGALKPGEKVLSPGMKYRHYAPKAPVFLLDGTPEEKIRYISGQGTENVAVLAYREEATAFHTALPEVTVYDFGLRTDTAVQAHTLFYLLREADKCNFRAIYAPLPDKGGIGLALYNRMIRAAAYQIVRLHG